MPTPAQDFDVAFNRPYIERIGEGDACWASGVAHGSGHSGFDDGPTLALWLTYQERYGEPARQLIFQPYTAENGELAIRLIER